jgi:ubiquinone/menaquinone biosynthesis C-methylase UbiE
MENQIMSKFEIQYWDKKALTYDNHLTESQAAYTKIVKFLKEDLTNNMFILDIGTGTGEIPLQIYKNVNKIDAIDFSNEMINIAKSKAANLNNTKINFYVGDINELPYEKKMLDAVIMSNLLHIIDEPCKLLSNVKNILKNNGIIIAPTYLHNQNIFTQIISLLLRKKGHPIKTKFNSKTIISLFKDNDFKILKNIYIKNIMPIAYVVAMKN